LGAVFGDTGEEGEDGDFGGVKGEDEGGEVGEGGLGGGVLVVGWFPFAHWGMLFFACVRRLGAIGFRCL
jgi:hypothetical protein